MAHYLCSIAECQNFGVRGGITGEFTFVMTSGDHLAVTHHHGAHRHIIMGESGTGLVKSLGHPHEMFVVG